MFFKKIKGDNKENNVIKVAALLIHAAKIDENQVKILLLFLGIVALNYGKKTPL